MPFIEAPTTFYIGRGFDPQSHKLADEVVYYDSRDLTTHAVVVGMTGSGKTGLCINLLEEAILDNIPAIIIDPKGDITNLMLTFPDLQPQDFQPWINVDDARRAGLDVNAFAADVAQRWRTGLQSWGIVPDRLRWMKSASKISIYTPGSDAGLPVSILASLRSPREGWVGNEEGNREKINGIVTALLALIGMNAEPVKDREHVLIANIFEFAWQRGQNLSLEDIILQVQKPPFTKLGVFPIDDYMSERDRYKLAMQLNSIVAAPSFQSWIQGASMDIQNLLYQPDGRPRVSIFYIAHLSEAERMFVMTLLLENMLGWMRSLSGTTSLRALLYIDEVFGYFPPYPRNPPSKEPMLRLLKQARAFGVGLILATQNPGDLDYKGLSNAGTWFIGRLQSENDKAKVMSGLETMVSADNNMNLKDIDRLISEIEPRVFLMHNVHDERGPIMVHTRWAMSYLRGPLTRQQVQILMQAQRQQLAMGGGTGAYPAFNQQPSGYNTPVPGGATGPLNPYNTQGMPPFPQTGGYTPQAGTGFPPPPPSLPEAPPMLPEFPAAPLAPPQQTYTPQTYNPQAANDYTQVFNQGYTQQTVPPAQTNVPPSGTSATVRGGAPVGYSTNQPPVAGSTPQYFLPNSITSQQAIAQWEAQTRFSAQGFGGAQLTYKPVLLAQAQVRYQARTTGVYTARAYAYQIPNLEKSGLVRWEQFQAAAVDPNMISGEPFGQALFGDLTPGLTDSKRFAALQREFIDVLYNTARLSIPFNPTLKIYGNPDGSISEFRSQVQQVAREKRDAEIDQVTAKYKTIIDRLDEKMTREQRDLSAERQELAERKREELFTTGEAVLSLLKGRTTYTLSRMSQTSRYSKQSRSAISESEQVLADLDKQINDTTEEFEKALQAVNERWAKIAAEQQENVLTPFKKDIHIELFGIGWVPFWYAVINGQTLLLPAYG